MRLSLPDMSGPPVWWDVLVLGSVVAVVGSALRHRYGLRRVHS